MKRPFKILARRNVKLAKEKWFDELGNLNLDTLRSLTESYGFAIALGDLLLLEGRWYVTHAGLLRLAARSRCLGIQVQQVPEFCDPVAGRWVFKATVYKSPRFERLRRLRGRRSLKRFLLWSTAPRCASPKLGPSIAPCARPTGSASVRSRSLAAFSSRLDRLPFRSPSNGSHPSNGSATASPGSGISSAF